MIKNMKNLGRLVEKSKMVRMEDALNPNPNTYIDIKNKILTFIVS